MRAGTPGDGGDDLAQFGLPPEQVAEITRAEPEEFGVWPENWEAVQMFLTLQTQWRCNETNGAYCGLRYTAVESVLRLHRVRDRKAVFTAIQTLEYAALEVLNRDK